MKYVYNLIEKGILPDYVLRLAIRYLLKKRLKNEKKGGVEQQSLRLLKLIEELKQSAIAVKTEKANEQHYEVLSDFYKLVLGDHLKYSSCFWDDHTTNLTDSEGKMLELYCNRAELSDGMNILELGCGWGSLSLYLAKKYPNSKITGVSNSASQREFIQNAAHERGIKNLQIITSNINDFSINDNFDRIISIEMFEHMRNYQELLKRISGWLNPEGKLFVHIFTNKKVAYLFEEEGSANWMGRYFFSGGIMPSDHLLLYFQENLKIDKHWCLNGNNYAKTAKAWHENQIKNKNQILPVLEKVYGKSETSTWFSRWKLFFMACEELFAYNNGEEWIVSHYLFNKQ